MSAKVSSPLYLLFPKFFAISSIYNYWEILKEISRVLRNPVLKWFVKNVNYNSVKISFQEIFDPGNDNLSLKFSGYSEPVKRKTILRIV